jgi:1-acyl-sn-glycerol-3-phosphate acyltransferase
MPVSVMNFVEGTRFTTGKHAQQGSTFRQLLKPRAGGVAFVLGAMGPALHAILDVTIAYPHGRPTIGDLFMDRVPEVRLHIQQLSIPAEFVGRDYQSDATFRQRFQAWMNQLWELKDERLDELTAAGSQHVIGR